MRLLPQAYTGFFLCVCMLGLCFGGAPVLIDPDTAWHLAAGDLIRTAHSIPARDPWSFTAGDETWYNLAWLFDAGFSALFAIAGFSGIYACTIFIFALCITLMGLHCLRRGASPIAVFIAVPLSLFVIYSGTLARPHMFSTLLTVIFYQILQRYRSRGRARDLLWLPALMVAWVNLHGGFLFAFFLMGLFLLESCLHRDAARRRGYGMVMALCLLATLVNPYGFEVYFGAFKTLTGAFDQKFVLEWKPVEIGRHLPMTLLLFVLLLTGDATDRRIPLVDRILAVLVLLMALSSVRHAVIAALLIMPYLSLRLSTVLQESRLGEHIRRRDGIIAADMRKKDIRILSAGMALIAFALVALPEPRDTLLKEPVGFPAKDFPLAAAAFISQHYPALRFFNDYNMGGYLVYIWRGGTRVFIDGRASSLYGKELLEDYPNFADYKGFGPNAERIAMQYGFDGLIVLNDGKDAGYWLWNPHWRKVYGDTVASVYLRSDPSHPARPGEHNPHSALPQKPKQGL